MGCFITATIFCGFIYSTIYSNVQIRHNEVMKTGARIYVPVSVAETRISKRFNAIPTGTLYPNADEIEYLQRLVKYKAHLYNLIILNRQVAVRKNKLVTVFLNMKLFMHLRNPTLNIATLVFVFAPLEMMVLLRHTR